MQGFSGEKRILLLISGSHEVTKRKISHQGGLRQRENLKIRVYCFLVAVLE